MIIWMTIRDAQAPHFHSVVTGLPFLCFLRGQAGEGLRPVGEHPEASATVVALGEVTPLSRPRFPPSNIELDLRFPIQQHISQDPRL